MHALNFFKHNSIKKHPNPLLIEKSEHEPPGTLSLFEKNGKQESFACKKPAWLLQTHSVKMVSESCAVIPMDFT